MNAEGRISHGNVKSQAGEKLSLEFIEIQCESLGRVELARGASAGGIGGSG